MQLRADDHVRAITLERVVEDRELSRMHVEVGVHEHDQLAARDLRAAQQRPALAGIHVEADQPGVLERRRRPLGVLDRAVGGAVVDEHDLVRRAEGCHRGIRLAERARDALGFVEGGDDDRDRVLAEQRCGSGGRTRPRLVRAAALGRWGWAVGLVGRHAASGERRASICFDAASAALRSLGSPRATSRRPPG
jgi:hypothetical protein